MANTLIIANVNCDQILRLSRPLQSGARIHYEAQGHRLGGGAVNTGLGLVWAQHQVTLLSQVGEDKLGDWLIEQATELGFNCNLVHRHVGDTQALQLLMEPNGERTILRPNRPRLILPNSFDPSPYDCIYVNLSAEGLPRLLRHAINSNALVVSQLPKDLAQRPCHYLLTSADDLAQHNVDDPWQFGLQIGGPQLRAFIVTQGKNGAIAYTSQGQRHCSAVATKVVDSTGAGDCYAGGLIHALTKGLPLQQAMEYGAQWAAYAVNSNSSLPDHSLQLYLQS
ncbi:PfkB family carbohydrate kinase [Ferrimonas lipolytica]|uniref:Ribokinase n=1 Tax=Ferrimonas lipolytica TaxID=2724191 RepID=A0A6H1UKH1_9GAMM|nr:PfkB family carbohydrate kinase [Ferrimonas lipolytica]QIZ78302.1 ribokinase [Ferrimonas lipolytica]